MADQQCVACEGARQADAVATYYFLSRRVRARVMVSYTITRAVPRQPIQTHHQAGVGAGLLDQAAPNARPFANRPCACAVADCVRGFLRGV